MRIEQLEYIAAVTETGSLRRASEHAHVSLPALSEAIAKLERELGVTLFDRQRSGARISRAGRELLPAITDVLEAVGRLRAAAGDHLATGLLVRLGTVGAGTAPLVFPAIRRFQREHPGSTVEVRNLQQDQIELALREGSLDLGIVNSEAHEQPPSDLHPLALRSGLPVAVVPAGHPLAAAPTVTVAALRREPFVAMRAGYLMHRLADRLFGAERPPAWHTADGADIGKLMVAAGLGVTILPAYSVSGDPLERAGAIVARPLRPAPEPVSLVALHRRQPHTRLAVRALLRALRETAADGAGDPTLTAAR